MSFTRKPYATLNSARRHSLRYSYCIHTTWLNKKGRFCDLLLCACQTQASNGLCSSHCSCLVGYSFERGLPLTFSQACLTWWQLLRHCKRYGHKGAAFKASRHHSGVVQWISATSYAFFTVTHQNGFSSSIQLASNLHLVCIKYLYERDAYVRFWRRFCWN
mgnify:CR=1 FL=1